jgi:hypothetical protein
MGITIDDIEALRRRLAELPRNQPREVSKQEAVTLLATELGAARRRGYSPEELAQLLSEQGVMINAPTLRGYLRRNRRSRKGGRSKGVTAKASGVSTAQRARGDSTPDPGTPSVPPAASVRSAPSSVTDPSGPPAKDALDGRGTKDAPGAGR